MPSRSDKHGEATERFFYPGFGGGLNLSVPAETLPRTELREAWNVEFSPLTGSMRVRGGLVWSGRFDGPVGEMVPVPGKRGFLVREKGTRRVFYFLWNCIWPVQGELSGDGEMTAATWGEPGEMVVASGGRLQKFEEFGQAGIPTLTAIPNSPEKCRRVFVRAGRVGVVEGPDTLRFSWVGDCEKWENDPDDASTGQFIEIGYKDGMDIVAVVPLSKDLMIFKVPEDEPDKGVIWRLVGDFPNWTPLQTAHNTGTFNSKSVRAVGNDVYYLTTDGLATLSSVTAYGEIKTAWPDRKVANTLTRLLNGTSRLWNVPVKQQLWVLPSDQDPLVWVLDYSRGIWTQFEFPVPPVFAEGVDTALYMAIGRDLYQLNDWYTQDELKDKPSSAIKARMQMGTILKGWKVLVKGAFASFLVVPESRACLKLGDFRLPLIGGGTPSYIYDDTDIAFEDDDPLFPPGNTLTARQRCLVRDWAIVPEVEIEGGGCSLSSLGLEIVEVH